MQLIEALLDLCKGSPSIIAIDGPAGAGKTTLAGEIKRAMGEKSVEVIHMDDLYAGWASALSSTLTEKLLTIIAAQRDRKPIAIDIYDWNVGAFTSTRLIEPVDLLILEGVGCGQSAVRQMLTTLIWMESSDATGLQRVLERDGQQIRDEMLTWQRIQREHFLREGTKAGADFEITT